MKSKAALTALLAVALLGTAAYKTHAAGMQDGTGMKRSGDGMGMMDCGGMMGGMNGSLHGGMLKHIKSQLTPEQIAQFDDVLKTYNKKIEPTQQSLFVKNQELKALQNAANPDIKAVSKTATEVVQLQSTLKNEREAFEEKIKKDFNVNDLHGGMMHGSMNGGMMHGKGGDQPNADAGHGAHK